MIPLSCVNCCHNPLRTGTVGYPIGYCTRLHVTLLSPTETTCGALQRKDLRRERAEEQRLVHARTFPTGFVSDLATRKRSAAVSAKPHAVEASDQLISEVMGYGVIPKIASLKSLSTIGSTRSELALSSLGRGYFANCMRVSGVWTAGLHLAWWTLRRLVDVPAVSVTDLSEGPQPVADRVQLAGWYVVSARLMLLLDVARAAEKQTDANGVPRLVPLINSSFAEVPAGRLDPLIRYLKRHRRQFEKALPERHYSALAAKLHRERDVQDVEQLT